MSTETAFTDGDIFDTHIYMLRDIRMLHGWEGAGSGRIYPCC